MNNHWSYGIAKSERRGDLSVKGHKNMGRQRSWDRRKIEVS